MEVFKRKICENGLEVLNIPELDDNFSVKTFFTMRSGGVSKKPFDSLNMGFNTDDDREAVEENRRRAFLAVGAEDPVVVYPNQVHGAEVACVSEADAYQARQKNSNQDAEEFGIIRFAETDAAVTNAKNVILTSLHADCIPVWLYDPVHHVAGLAHAGWRGTRADIAAKTASEMHSEYGSQFSDIIAVIGPGIGKCCFEVGGEVYEEFASIADDIQDYSVDDGNGKFHLDLKGINARLLRKAGIGRILLSDYCTCCEKNIFYSYRREAGNTGRMCAGICLV